uniref:Protein NLRC3 n=1 Tax=Haematococcus lacustris TaxID=44745 RepID=A0A699YGW3_HAELA
MSEQGVALLASALPTNVQLRALSLQGSSVGDLGVVPLARAIRHSRTLTSLNLRGCGLTGEGLVLLAGGVADNRGLTALDLSANTMSGAAVLVDTVACNQHITHLSLASSPLQVPAQYRLQDASMALLAAALPALSFTLTRLHLTGHTLGLAACSELAAALPLCPHLNHLDLGLTKLADPGLVLLTPGLQACPSLTHLVLSGLQGLQLPGARALANLLRGPCSRASSTGPTPPLSPSTSRATLAPLRPRVTAGSQEGDTGAGNAGMVAGLTHAPRPEAPMTLGLPGPALPAVQGSSLKAAGSLPVLAAAASSCATLVSLDLSGCSEVLLRPVFNDLLGATAPTLKVS